MKINFDCLCVTTEKSW